MFDSITSWIAANPEQCIILVLFLVSEILGNMPQFKANSVIQLIILVLKGMVAKTKFGVFVGDVPTDPPANPSDKPKQGGDENK